MSRDSNRLASIHFQRNALTRGDWESFAPHRRRVTELILAAADGANPSLCVLGAGNGNDLELRALADRYSQITLVDLDDEALEHCLSTQGERIRSQVEAVSGADLSGLIGVLSSQDDRPEIIAAAVERAGRPPDNMLASYDVVVSTCLLTQMIDSVVTAIGAGDDRCAPLVLALRDGHLRFLRELTAAEGTALLITDFVSSDTLPQLKQVPDDELEPLLAGAIADRNFFTGVNPGVLMRQMESIGGGASRLHPPWRWTMGSRTYAVCAVSMKLSGPKVQPVA